MQVNSTNLLLVFFTLLNQRFIERKNQNVPIHSEYCCLFASNFKLQPNSLKNSNFPQFWSGNDQQNIQNLEISEPWEINLNFRVEWGWVVCIGHHLVSGGVETKTLILNILSGYTEKINTNTSNMFVDGLLLKLNWLCFRTKMKDKQKISL